MPRDPLERLPAVTIGEIEQRGIVLVEHDEAWHERVSVEAARIEGRLGAGALRVEHVGSTAVCGLAAKPIVDILLVVTDPSDEAAYVPPLHDAGYELRIREPQFFEHRMLRTANRDCTCTCSDRTLPRLMSYCQILWTGRGGVPGVRRRGRRCHSVLVGVRR